MTIDKTKPVLQVCLYGPFRVFDQQGADLTPKGAKAQALLAMICRSETLHRSRAWLQDKLWSDRAKEQGAGSLRQALSEIRRAFGLYHDVLLADRQSIRLDPNRVVLVASKTESGAEFLEGLDVADPEFEEWLRVERQATPGRAAVYMQRDRLPVRKELVLRLQDSGSDMDQLFAEVVAKDASVVAKEFFGIQSSIQKDQRIDDDSLHLSVKAASAQGTTLLHANLIDPLGQRSVWSMTRQLQAFGAPAVHDERVLQLIHETGRAVAEYMAGAEGYAKCDAFDDPSRKILVASKLIFTLNAADQDRADRLLLECDDGAFAAVSLAWRAILRVVQMMERNLPNLEAQREEIQDLVTLAMQLDPMNSNVLAANAYAQVMIFDNGRLCEDLGRRATLINPSNPFAWLSRAFGMIQLGQPEEAFRYMNRAHALQSQSNNRHFWDCMAGVGAVSVRKFDLAMQLFEMAHALAPNFRPPLRYLIALKAAARKPDGALDAISKLKVLEPDFSVDRLIHDQAYPAAMMRRTGLTSNAQLEYLI